MFGITHLESMFRLRRNQISPNRNWKRSQREISKDASPFPKNFFLQVLPHIFAITKQLPGFSISRLASVEYLFNVHIYFLNVNICVRINDYLFEYIHSSVLLKTLFLLSHLFCNVKFEFSWFHNTKQSSEILIQSSEILIHKVEILFEF